MIDKPKSIAEEISAPITRQQVSDLCWAVELANSLRKDYADQDKFETRMKGADIALFKLMIMTSPEPSMANIGVEMGMIFGQMLKTGDPMSSEEKEKLKSFVSSNKKESE